MSPQFLSPTRSSTVAGIVGEAIIWIKKWSYEFEAARLFGVNNRFEAVQTKNVVEASVLRPTPALRVNSSGTAATKNMDWLTILSTKKRERVSRSRF
jgi:hypothetical protein